MPKIIISKREVDAAVKIGMNTILSAITHDKTDSIVNNLVRLLDYSKRGDEDNEDNTGKYYRLFMATLNDELLEMGKETAEVLKNMTGVNHGR